MSQNKTKLIIERVERKGEGNREGEGGEWKSREERGRVEKRR